MKSHNRELLVLIKSAFDKTGNLESQVESLHYILRQVERNDVFCNAHELVKRIRITNRKSAIIKAISDVELKPFYFLINKN